MPLPAMLQQIQQNPLTKRVMSSRLLQILVAATMSFVAFLIYVSSQHKCDMSGNLQPLLTFTTQTLTSARIAYWLDYGSLLGAVRDGGTILSHEFDTDIGLHEVDCPRALQTLRDTVSQSDDASVRGLHVYGQSEYVPGKGSALLGYSSYLHAPCARVYDSNGQYYTDIYWYRTVSPQTIRRQMEMSQMGKTVSQEMNQQDHIDAQTHAAAAVAHALDAAAEDEIDSKTSRLMHAKPTADAIAVAAQKAAAEVRLVAPPPDYNPLTDGLLLCNDEAYDEAHEPGGCKRLADVMPLKSFTMKSGLTVTIPHNAEKLLFEMYGQDWRTPRAKGYKGVVCRIVPRPWILATIIATAIIAIVFVCRASNQQAKPQLRYTQL